MQIDFNKQVIPQWEHNPFMNLLKLYTTKQIDQKEFEKELAYGAMVSIHKLVYEPEPMEPVKLLELRALKATADWKKKEVGRT